MKSAKWLIGLPALLTLAFATPSPADTVLGFDFDIDGDPTTMNSSIEAEVGELVEAYMVFVEIPDWATSLIAIQFGIAHTVGLEYRAMSVVGGRGMMITEGIQAMAWAFANHPFQADDLPGFGIRFVFEVLDTSPQEVSIIDAGWPWNIPIELIVTNWSGDWVVISDPTILERQIRGVVNGTQTPVLEKTWGQLKGFYVNS